MPDLFWMNCRVPQLLDVGHEIFTMAEGVRKAAGAQSHDLYLDANHVIYATSVSHLILSAFVDHQCRSVSVKHEEMNDLTISK